MKKIAKKTKQSISTFITYAFVLLLLALVIPLLLLYFQLEFSDDLVVTTDVLTESDDRQSLFIPFTNPIDFSFDVTSITIDENGARLLDNSQNAIIELQDPIYFEEGTEIIEFSSTVDDDSLNNDGVLFQIASDFGEDSWEYFDGQNWSFVQDCSNCGNTIEEFNNHIEEYEVTNDFINIRTVFNPESGDTARLFALQIDLDGELLQLTRQQINWLAPLTVSASEQETGCLCQGGNQIINAKYLGASGVDVNISSNKGFITTFTNVQFEQILRIDGSQLSGSNFGNALTIDITSENQSIEQTEIPANCGQEIVGNTYGNFEIISRVDKNNNECTLTDVTTQPTSEESPETETPPEQQEEDDDEQDEEDDDYSPPAQSTFENGCMCEGKIKKFIVEYSGPNGVTVAVSTRKYGDISTFTNVQNGDFLEINGSNTQVGTLWTETYLDITNAPEDISRVSIHTSCSENIEGQTYGNFTVQYFVDKENNQCGDTPPPPPPEISACVAPGVIDFDFDGNNNALVAGQLIDTEWSNLGISMTSDNANHPLMIFDSSNPSGNDLDLGTPNEDFGGPGVGTGGESGEPGQNSLEQGNILILSKDGNQSNPDDFAGGGSMIITFDNPTTITDLSFVDTDTNEGVQIVAFDDNNNQIASASTQNLGDNSFQIISLNAEFVSRLEVTYTGSGSLAAFSSCESIPPTPPPPPPPPPEVPPTANNDEISVCTEDESVTINALANDTSDETIDTNSLEVISGPGHGVTQISNGEIVYTPDDLYVGEDSFTYKVCEEGDNESCDTAIVTVTVEDCIVVEPQVNFTTSSTPVCEYEPTTLDVTGSITLEEGVQARLQLAWSIVNPSDKVDGPNIINLGTVENADTFTTQVSWPGIEYDDSSVEIVLEATLLDLDTNQPLSQNTNTANIFWNNSVCEPPPPPPQPDFSIFVECVQINNDNTYTALFGYVNRLDNEQLLSRSSLTPSNETIIGTPPQTLNPGRVQEAFGVTAPIGTNVVWTAKADNVTKTSTANSNFKACPTDPPPPTEVVVVFEKIVCEDESDLPNWINTSIELTDTTALDFVTNNPNCSLASDWQFQWGDQTVTNLGNNSGEFSESTGWQTTDVTNQDGRVSITFSQEDLADITQLSFREVFQDDFVPFSNSDNVSAEFYCSTDGTNFDNFESITPALGQTYQCIALNAQIPPTGSITVCKVIINSFDEIVDGSEVINSEFFIPGNPAPQGYSQGGILPNTQLNTPITFNQDILFNDGENDAQCITYNDLPLGGYFYNQEIITSSDSWEAPLYNDQFQTTVTTLEDFATFSNEIYTPDTQDDNNRDKNADGHIVINEGRPNRTLVVLNQYNPPTLCGNGQVDLTEQCDDGNTLNGDGCSSLCEIETVEIEVVAHKILCTSEEDLPNWGGGAPNITETTAQEFVNSNENCEFLEGWEFEWAPNGIANPNDNLENAGGSWSTFTPTDSNGVTSQTITLNPQENRIWMREALQEGYVQFTGTGGSNISAEFYCHTDVLNYDNYDFISGIQDGQTYYCVGFNALEIPEPVCGNSIVEQGEQCDDGNNQNGDGCSVQCTNKPIEIIAHKIVCEEETDLPNWANTDISISENTALDFVTNNPDCNFVSDWQFQWGNVGAEIPDSNFGEVAELEGWTSFGPTNSSGEATVVIDSLPQFSNIGMREVWQEEFIPFTSNSDVSAEMYCDTDVTGFDNYELISNATFGNTYYCVAFNVEDIPVVPNYSLVTECIDINTDGTYTASFGYINLLNQPQQLDISEILPLESIGTPPTTLQPGNFDEVFTVNAQSDQVITWNTQVGNTIQITSADLNTPLCTQPPEEEPPTPLEDSLAVCNDEVNTIAVLANDTDANDNIDLSSLSITSLPSNGEIIDVNTTNGTISYSSEEDFEGIDAFSYEICDDTGLCTQTTVTVLAEDCAPVEPLAFSGIVDMTANQCGGVVYSNSNLTFSGTYSGSSSEVENIQYILESEFLRGNLAEQEIELNGNNFSFDLLNLPSGDYDLQVLVTTETDTTTSPVCEFVVDESEQDPGCLIFGANEFILESQASPISDFGVISFVEDQPQEFFLESRCATEASVVNLDTTDVYPLEYDSDLKLWRGPIEFENEGAFRLQGVTGSTSGVYTREINTAVVSRRSTIVDSKTNTPVTNAQITVFEEDPDDPGTFELWDAQAYGFANPFEPLSNGEYSVVLPKGSYFLEITADGYLSSTSLITQVEENSVVRGNVRLLSSGNIFDQFFRLIERSNNTNNFALEVTPLPNPTLLEIGEVVPVITGQNQDEQAVTFFEENTEQPTVLMVYSSWNTLSEEQLIHFLEVSEQLPEYNFVPITTMEPNNVNVAYTFRGRYDIDVITPNEEFFDDYSIISLPHFFLVNEQRELEGMIVGPQLDNELETKIVDILEN